MPCLALVLLLGFLILGFTPPAVLDASVDALPIYPSQVQAIRRALPPEVSAAVYAVVDGETGNLVAGVKPHQRLAPASTAKIATAIVALERGRLDDTVRADFSGEALGDASLMGLVPGDRLSLRDLLYGLLLPSGADAAVAIARHIGGDEARFVVLMNGKAAELGLKDTRFANPHGLDDPTQYSSPFDLSVLARYAMANPDFAAIVRTSAYTAQGANHAYPLKNTNQLIGTYQGADGVKTGTTDDAGQALVASAIREGRRVFVAVLRSQMRYEDSVRLLDYFWANYSRRALDLPRGAFGVAMLPDGTPLPLGARPAPTLTLPNWQWRYVRPAVLLDNGVTATAGTEARLGFVAFYLGNRLLVESQLYAR